MSGSATLLLKLRAALEAAEMRIQATNDISYAAELSCCSAIKLDSQSYFWGQNVSFHDHD